MFSPEVLKTAFRIENQPSGNSPSIRYFSAILFTWENGKTKPNGKNIDKLADILGVPTSYFESEYKIVKTYLQLNAINREKVEDYAEDLLTVQQQDNVVELYSIHVLDEVALSAGIGESIYGESESVEVFRKRIIHMTWQLGLKEIPWNLFI